VRARRRPVWFVTLAGDVAAMAPRTNIGAATPVSLGGNGSENEVLGRKVRNDAAAYVRALAEGRERNADLSERMVRDAVSVSATRALQRGPIDVVAANPRPRARRSTVATCRCATNFSSCW
jgi:membrane-bound serine protease (ClpP class)